MIGEGILNFTDNDLVCYKGKESIEIIINDYYVENRTEHDKVVKKLLKYIFQQEKNTKIVQKINTNPFSEFDGVTMVYMPSEKKLLATEYIEPLLTMISNVTECSKFKNNINLSVTITNNNNDHSIHNNHSITTINNNENNNDNVKDFGKYIRDTRPEWYTPETLFDKNSLLTKYENIYGSISKHMFHKSFIGKIFNKTTRVGIRGIRYTKVMLFKYDEILDLNGE